MINASEAYRLGYTGAGVTIGILDSGIVAWHPEFTNQIVGGYDFLLNQAVTQNAGADTDGHGSHVSGIMAARRDGIGMHGVAFNAKLFSSRYGDEDEDDEDEGDDFDIGSGPTYADKAAVMDPVFSKALNYMAKQNLAVINNSVGFNNCDADTVLGSEPCNITDFRRSTETAPTKFDADDLFGETVSALHALKNAGTLMVFATGNEAQLHPDFLAGAPLLYPDLKDNWLAVTSVDVNTGNLAVYANRCGDAKSWCLAAPGSYLSDTVIDENNIGIASVSNSGGYVRLSGTSMAAPHVTGAAALVKEAFPFFNAYQLQQTLLTTATDLTPIDGHRFDSDYGWGLLNVGKAVRGPGLFVSNFDVDTLGYSATFSNDIGDLYGDPAYPTQRGSLIKRGAGTLTLTGTNSYSGATVVEGGTLVIAGTNNTGDTTVNGGKLVVNGTIAPATTTTVNQYGTLGGSGTLGNLTNNGLVAPGNSIGTLTVTGNYFANPGSVLQLEVDGGNSFDILKVTGTATLENGSTLSLLGGPFRQGVSYDFLQAPTVINNGLKIDTSLIFLSPSLALSGTGLSLSVARNNTAFSVYGQTNNQRAVANALDAFSSSPPTALSRIYDDVLNATARTLPGLMDELSGEAHASVQSALFTQSEQWTSTVTQRLNHVMTRPVPASHHPMWVTVQRQWADLNGSNGSADTRSYTNGLYLGGDTALVNGWRAGAALGAHDSRIETGERRSRADAHSYTAALYGGKHWPTQNGNALNWRISAAYTRHNIDTRRNLNAGGAQTLTADYHANQIQTFTELGYALPLADRVVLEPYGRVGWTQLRASGLRENGGNAALQSGSHNEQVTTLTLGLRAYSEIALNPTTVARVSADLGWRHANGNLTPQRHMSFAGAPDARFTVDGAPITRNALQLALNGEVDTGKNTAIGINYNGQFGGGNTANTGSLYVNIKF